MYTNMIELIPKISTILSMELVQKHVYANIIWHYIQW